LALRENRTMSLELRVVEDASAAADEVARLLVGAVRAGASIALSGGSTPRSAYERAASSEPDWGTASLWLADERCVPLDDPLSNQRLVRETILDRVAVRPRWHAIATHLGVDEAADRYEDLLRTEGVPRVVLLGVGADGHTASLFPGSPALREHTRFALATEAGTEPFVPRITLTLPAIAACDHVVFLVTGREKAEQVRRAFAAEPSDATPASLARSSAGATTAVLDEAAASSL
jgi:6-phosphogluconolactonase